MTNHELANIVRGRRTDFTAYHPKGSFQKPGSAASSAMSTDAMETVETFSDIRRFRSSRKYLVCGAREVRHPRCRRRK